MRRIHSIKLAGTLAAAGIIAGAIMSAAADHGTAMAGRSGAEAEATAEATEFDVVELWRANCAGCHGRDGKGQTRVGRRAGVKDLTDHEHQKTIPSERAFKHIKKGMYDNGEEQMKPFGKGLSDDNGLTDAEISALVQFIRTFDPKWTEES